jgi:hypothetical protein
MSVGWRQKIEVRRLSFWISDMTRLEGSAQRQMCLSLILHVFSVVHHRFVELTAEVCAMSILYLWPFRTPQTMTGPLWVLVMEFYVTFVWQKLELW